VVSGDGAGVSGIRYRNHRVEVSDEVTVVGFAVPMGVRAFVQTDGRAAPDVEAAVRDRVESHVQVSTHESERVLLRQSARSLQIG